MPDITQGDPQLLWWSVRIHLRLSDLLNLIRNNKSVPIIERKTSIKTFFLMFLFLSPFLQGCFFRFLTDQCVCVCVCFPEMGLYLSRFFWYQYFTIYFFDNFLLSLLKCFGVSISNMASVSITTPGVPPKIYTCC